MNKAVVCTLTLAIMAATMLPITVQARPKVSLEQAVEVCTERAIRFGRQIYGRHADEPLAYLVQDRYRACVYAKSGQYPTAKVQYRESILTLLKDTF